LTKPNDFGYNGVSTFPRLHGKGTTVIWPGYPVLRASLNGRKMPNIESIKAKIETQKARIEPFLTRHERLISFLKDLQSAWGIDRPTRLSAALAYYGMFSLAPVIFIAFTVADLLIDELAAENQLFDQLEKTLGPETAEFVYDMVINVSQRTTTGALLTSLIGFVALLWAASGLFMSLRDALNTIWKAPPNPKGGIIATIENRLLAFGLVVGVGLVLTLAALVNVTLSILNSTFDVGFQTPLANYGSMIGLVMLAFALLYKILPNVHVGWRDVWLGALLATLLVGIAGWGLGIYLSRSNIGSAFEAAGTLAVLLVAMNYIAQIFLFGAIFTKVYSHHFGSRSKQAEDEHTGTQDEAPSTSIHDTVGSED
jgi:membrane protein